MGTGLSRTWLAQATNRHHTGMGLKCPQLRLNKHEKIKTKKHLKKKKKTKPGLLRSHSALPASYLLNLFHLEQRLPHSALGSSVSPIGGISPSTIPLLPSQNLWCTESFPPANLGNQKSNGPFARDVLRHQSKHRCASLWQPSPTLLHLLQEFHHFSACFLWQIQQNFGMKTITSYSCLCLIATFRVARFSLQNGKLLLVGRCRAQRA